MQVSQQPHTPPTRPAGVTPVIQASGCPIRQVTASSTWPRPACTTTITTIRLPFSLYPSTSWALFTVPAICPSNPRDILHWHLSLGNTSHSVAVADSGLFFVLWLVVCQFLLPTFSGNQALSASLTHVHCSGFCGFFLFFYVCCIQYGLPLAILHSGMGCEGLWSALVFSERRPGQYPGLVTWELGHLPFG